MYFHLNLKLIALTVVAFFCSTASAFSQSSDTTWSVHGNHADSTYLGTNNYKDLKIITDSTVRIVVSKDGYVEMKNDLLVPNGKMVTDSISGGGVNPVNFLTDMLNPAGSLDIDSIHVRAIASDSIRFNGTAIFDTLK